MSTVEIPVIPQFSPWLWSRGDGIIYKGITIVNSSHHHASLRPTVVVRSTSSSSSTTTTMTVPQVPSVTTTTNRGNNNPSSSPSSKPLIPVTCTSTNGNTVIKRSSIKGKKAGKGLPGGKNQLRAALIAEKRAARAQHNSDFDPVYIVDTLLDYIQTLDNDATHNNTITDSSTHDEDYPMNDNNNEPVDTRTVYPIKFEFHHVARVAREFTMKICKLLYYQYIESGNNKDKRTIILYKYKEKFPSVKEKQSAIDTANNFLQEGHGQGVVKVIQLQKEVKQSRKDKRSHEKQYHGGGSHKLKKLFVTAEDSSSSTDESSSSVSSDYKMEGHSATNAAVPTSPKSSLPVNSTTSSSFKIFLPASSMIPIAESDNNVSINGSSINTVSVVVTGPSGKSSTVPVNVSDTDSSSSSSPYSSSESDSEDNTGTNIDEQDLIDQFNYLGLGVSQRSSDNNNNHHNSWDPVPPPSSSSLIVGTAVPDTLASSSSSVLTVRPLYQGTWENHTRGIGGKLLYRMGYTGGKLGRYPPKNNHHSNNTIHVSTDSDTIVGSSMKHELGTTNNVNSSSLSSLSIVPVVIQGSMPEPLEGEYRKGRLGIGSYNI